MAGAPDFVHRSFDRRSFVYRKLEAAGATFDEADGSARDFGDAAGEAAAARRLGLADFSLVPRTGFKGAGAAEWLANQGVEVPAESNWARRQADGAVAARLAPAEVLVLGDPAGTGTLVFDLDAAWAADGSPERGYPVPRRDTHSWFLVGGERSAELFAKLCEVDLRPARFAPGRVAQTVVAGIGAIVVRDDLGGVPAYHLLATSASAEYLWDCLTDAMAEFDGRPIGLSAVRELISQV